MRVVPLSLTVVSNYTRFNTLIILQIKPTTDIMCGSKTRYSRNKIIRAIVYAKPLIIVAQQFLVLAVLQELGGNMPRKYRDLKSLCRAMTVKTYIGAYSSDIIVLSIKNGVLRHRLIKYTFVDSQLDNVNRENRDHHRRSIAMVGYYCRHRRRRHHCNSRTHVYHRVTIALPPHIC